MIPSFLRRSSNRDLTTLFYNQECAAAIAYRNHYFNLYHHNGSAESLAAFRRARRSCRSVLWNAKSSYAGSVQARIGKENLGSQEFWRITNRVLNREEASTPTVSDGPEIISSSIDKADLFAFNFALNATIDDENEPLPDFPLPTEHKMQHF